VAIYRLIAKGSFDPEQIKLISASYEAALADLKLNDRRDPLTELIASTIIEVSKGEHDPVKLKERAFKVLGLSKPTLP